MQHQSLLMDKRWAMETRRREEDPSMNMFFLVLMWIRVVSRAGLDCLLSHCQLADFGQLFTRGSLFCRILKVGKKKKKKACFFFF